VTLGIGKTPLQLEYLSNVSNDEQRAPELSRRAVKWTGRSDGFHQMPVTRMAEDSPDIAYDFPTQGAVYAHAGNLHGMVEFIAGGKKMVQGSDADTPKLLACLVAQLLRQLVTVEKTAAGIEQEYRVRNTLQQSASSKLTLALGPHTTRLGLLQYAQGRV
jgi:hypothetical protein